MLRKLRIKFVALIMAIAAVLLVCAFAAICWMDRQQSVHDADAALEMALMRAVNGPEQAQPTGAASDGAAAVPDGAVAEGAGRPWRGFRSTRRRLDLTRLRRVDFSAPLAFNFAREAHSDAPGWTRL